MKQIIRTICEYKLGDYSVRHQRSTWHYGAPSETVVLNHSPAVLRENNTCGFWVESGFFGRKYIFVNGSTYSERLTDKTTASTILSAEVLHDYTFKDLAEHLPAEELVEWCKDHGMTEIKI